MITTATTGPNEGTDPITAAVRRLTEAGITAVEVPRCPDSRCAACADHRLASAA